MTQHGTPLAILFAIYSICFLGAAFNHARDILIGGFLPYGDAPLCVNAFWTSLTIMDPLVPLLFLIGRVKPALLLAAAIMVTDVAVNTHYAYYHRDFVYEGNVDLLAQTAFLVFIAGTAPVAWVAVTRSRNGG